MILVKNAFNLFFYFSETHERKSLSFVIIIVIISILISRISSLEKLGGL